MSRRLTAFRRSYPSQFWLILAGLLMSTIGTSMVWPFLTIYVSEQLDLPLAQIAGLITLNGFVAFLASLVAGPVADRTGRKSLMVASLAGSGITYLLFVQAHSYAAFAILMALRGFFQPLYRVATDAMVSDIVTPEQRADAFALVRMSNNLGIAIGPAIGGFVVVSSYMTSFYIAAVALLFFGLLIAFFTRETVPQEGREFMGEAEAIRPRSSMRRVANTTGYDRIIKDKQFLIFLFSFTLFQICSVMLWVLLAVYAKQNYQLPESQYGLLATTNALMVVLFQVPVTRITKRYLPLPVLAVGAFIYSAGVTSVALGQSFWGFWISYVIVTVGELIMLPTANSYVAQLAPVDMRGRYMSSLSLTKSLSRSIAPVLGGLLNDHIGPKAIWLGGGAIGMLGSLCFVVMAGRYSPEAIAARKEQKAASG